MVIFMCDIKNKKGFTLIELLAVIIILGVIMTIAIPNIIATLDKNKRYSLIKDARRVITSCEYTIRSEQRYEWPESDTAVVFPLNKIKNMDLKVSPFDTYYSLEKSFVAITKEPDGEDYKWVYYVHLVSCPEESCDSANDNDISQNRGLNLTREDYLNQSGRYEYVVKGDEVILDYLSNGSGGTYEGIKAAINVFRNNDHISPVTNIVVY